MKLTICFSSRTCCSFSCRPRCIALEWSLDLSSTFHLWSQLVILVVAGRRLAQWWYMNLWRNRIKDLVWDAKQRYWSIALRVILTLVWHWDGIASPELWYPVLNHDVICCQIEMEQAKLDSQTDYWLVQYQRLMDSKPQALIDMVSCSG